MEILKKHIDALVLTKMDLLKSKELFLNNSECLQMGLREEFESLAELAEVEVSLERYNFFNISRTTPLDYKERVLELSEKHFLLAGIRFRGLDVAKPFVSVHTNFLVSNEKMISEISNLVRSEFSIFAPKAIHLTIPCKSEIFIRDIKIDRYTIVGVIDELVQKELPLIPNHIELVALSDMSFYEEYLEEYAKFYKRSPILQSEVKVENIEDFKVAVQENLLYKIIIDGVNAGIIAGVENDYYGLKGVSILEEILFEPFIGLGFGAYIQKAFTFKLKDRYSILWGTISHLNTPSLKTALKNGRQVTEMEYVFQL